MGDFRHMSAPTFRTITDADWQAMFRAHRALGHFHGNSILAKIRARIAANASRPTTATPERQEPAASQRGSMVRRSDAFFLPAAGSADRKGNGTPRAEAGGADTFTLGAAHSQTSQLSNPGAVVEDALLRRVTFARAASAPQP
jgi:hypothetical protein